MKPKTSVDSGEVREDSFLLTSTERKPLKWTPRVVRTTAGPGWMEGRVDEGSDG